MIDMLIFVGLAAAAGAVGLWLGIVVVAPRLQRRVDRATSSESDEPAMGEEPDGPAD